MQVVRNDIARQQAATVSLRTSDPKFSPRWASVPAPSLALQLERSRSTGYTAGTRTATPVEVAYCLVDESFRISPVSAAVTLNPTIDDWECVGTTPNVPMWTRAVGILWVWRNVGQKVWKPFAADGNHVHSWLADKPFKAISGWEHKVGGHWLYFIGIGFPDLSNAAAYPPSQELTVAPPAPSVRLLECPNNTYEVAYSWACNQGETALSPVLTVSNVPGVAESKHAPISLLRPMPGGNCQPPQGALGMYVYMRKPGGAWHRQPCPDGLTGYLWALDVVTLPVNQFVESNIAPQAGGGQSYLSSLHLALRDWSRDIIVDSDVSICCPLISEWNGATWRFQPINHFVASFAIGATQYGTWQLMIDGVATPPMACTSDQAVWKADWQPVFDATYGVGSITIGTYGGNASPKFELTGKYEATDMAGRVSFTVKNGNGNAIVPDKVEQAGRGWVMSHADTKFKRKIATSNAGNWRVTDTATTPDGVTGYPMGWPLWLECSQRTKLVGCDFSLTKSNCGIATCDNSGGGCFHFNPVECSVAPALGNPNAVTFGFRCVDSSSWGWNGHLCSELIMEKCHLQAKFPIVCEGCQAANWQLRDINAFGDGSFDSAIITQANGGAITCAGRFTCDNARTLCASVWSKKLDIQNIWIDGGIPCLLTCNANSFPTLILTGGKINQWNNWLHAIESPAGPAEPYKIKFVTDLLDSQQNQAVTAKMCSPKANVVYSPRVAAEVPAILASLLP